MKGVTFLKHREHKSSFTPNGLLEQTSTSRTRTTSEAGLLLIGRLGGLGVVAVPRLHLSLR